MTFCNFTISFGITASFFFFIRLPPELFMSAHVEVNKEVSQFSASVKLLVTDALNLNRPHIQPERGRPLTNSVFTLFSLSPTRHKVTPASVCHQHRCFWLPARARARTAGRACARLRLCVFLVPRTGTRWRSPAIRATVCGPVQACNSAAPSITRRTKTRWWSRPGRTSA